MKRIFSSAGKAARYWSKNFLFGQLCSYLGTAWGVYTARNAHWLVIAEVGNGADFVFFYTAVSLQELAIYIHRLGKGNRGNLRSYPGIFLRSFRNVICDFGIGEALDATVIRPFCLSFFPYIIGDLFWGIIAGTMTADAVFYTSAALSRKGRKAVFGL
ncbi:MAG: hypothetical protein PHP25_00835 [Candidatus Moranbacteria bacterium]|nr:hypothetical protein [Candidatus Moranbacteria bacterium]